MNSTIKEVTYSNTSSYATLNTLNTKTKNVWVVFHGIGYLSRYFLKYFDELNVDENYIIAPQAPSKYYLNDTYRHVGASWLTKEDTVQETENVLRYIDSILKAEAIPKHCKLFIFGFSQGVSVATRWVALHNVVCDKLILYAGGLPKELVPDDFLHLKKYKTQVLTIVGSNDVYLNPERLKEEKERTELLFQGTAEHISFEGGHEVKKDLINSLT